MLPKILCILACGCALSAAAQHAPAGYDAALAQKLGADERGMRMYSLVLLKPGPRTDIPKAEEDSLFRGHMANIGRLAKAGDLAVAGPLAQNDRYSGLFVLTTPTHEAAEALLRTDPAIAGGALAYDIYQWYSTAALMEIPALHEQLQKP